MPQRATLTYQRGSGELRAQFAERKVAVERGAAALALLDKLSEQARDRLKKGKTLSLTAVWEAVGNGRKLVELSED